MFVLKATEKKNIKYNIWIKNKIILIIIHYLIFYLINSLGRIDCGFSVALSFVERIPFFFTSFLSKQIDLFPRVPGL